MVFSKNYKDYLYNPVFLEGKGEIIDVEKFADNHTYEITVYSESALIQMAIIYYPGYEITITDLTREQSYVLDGENVDGLVSFELITGSYVVETNYVGTDLRKASIIYTCLSVGTTSFLLIYGLYYEFKRRKEDGSKTC